MKKEKRRILAAALLAAVVAVAVALCFLKGISGLSRGYSQEDMQRLEEVLRRAAVTCYAAEGFYPPTLEYMEEHYGLQIDKENYEVSYNVIAENLMPDITVLEK